MRGVLLTLCVCVCVFVHVHMFFPYTFVWILMYRKYVYIGKVHVCIHINYSGDGYSFLYRLFPAMLHTVCSVIKLCHMYITSTHIVW